MSKNIGHLCLLFAAATLLVSCLDTDYTDDVTLYDDIAITQFQITSAKITKHTTSSTGEDSTYVVDDQSVADYPFYIDQLKGEIYNVDSLPVGVDATKLLCGVYTKNNAMVYIENAARDSMKSLSSTDSTDFSKPRYLRAYASDARSYRLYKVTVNIHREVADEFRWTRMADNASLAAMGGMRLVWLGGRMVLFGLEGGSTVVYTTEASDGNTWTATGAAFGPDAYNNVAVKGDTLFVLDGGTLRRTTDGTAFEAVAAQGAPQRLVGASTTELYGIDASGAMVVSADGGRSWRNDATDAPGTLLPAQDMASCTAPYGYVDSTDYVMLAGNRSIEAYPDDSTAVVWRKIVEYSNGSEQGKWVYMDQDSRNNYLLPRLAGLTVIAYGDSELAFGGAGIGGCKEQPFSRIYESRDGGITWKANSSYAYPDAFDTSATAFAAATDADGHIWIVCAGTGQVWRGRLNSMGWQQ